MHFTRLLPISESESDSECDSKTSDSKKADSVCERKSHLGESDSEESGDDEPPIPYYELSGPSPSVFCGAVSQQALQYYGRLCSLPTDVMVPFSCLLCKKASHCSQR